MRATRNPNDLIEEESTLGERVADHVARFGGSWTFIITFGVLMTIYTAINVLLHLISMLIDVLRPTFRGYRAN